MVAKGEDLDEDGPGSASSDMTRADFGVRRRGDRARAREGALARWIDELRGDAQRPPRSVARAGPAPGADAVAAAADGGLSRATAHEEEWIRSHAGLYGSRVLYLGQEIDDEEMNRVIAELLFLDAEEVANQYLYINSPGGSVIAGLALYDVMQHVGSPVITANIGMAASMASFILGAGVRGKRVALPNSRVMIHQPMGGSEGQAEDVRVEAEQIMKIKNTLVTMYAQMTGQTRERVIQDLGRDNYMSAQAALEYGLIDKIIDVPGSGL